MPRSIKSDQLAENLASSLKSTTELVQKLLDEIRDNSTSVAIMKEKFESLNENVATLSHIVRSGNGKGSMITRLALTEKAIEDLNEHLVEIKKCTDEKEQSKEEDDLELKKFKRDRLIARIGFWGALLPGVIALIMQLASFIK